ncbi:MAG: hypothetical protein WBD24_02370 [Candidatus Omnitrophota bacterium]
MYRRCAIKFNRKKVEFIDCVNLVERVKRARALPSGVEHLGIRRFQIHSSEFGNKTYYMMRDCL